MVLVRLKIPHWIQVQWMKKIVILAKYRCTESSKWIILE
jgi:hypothetical protein